MVGLECPGEFVGDLGDLVAGLLAVERCVQVDTLAAARHRHRVESHAGQDDASQTRHLGALLQPGSRPRIQVQHHAVGILAHAGATELPLRNMDLECGDLTEPGERGEVIDQRIGVDVVGVLDLPAQHPLRRRPLVEVLLEEHLAGFLVGSHAVYPALAGRRAVGGMPDEGVGDPGVVVEHVSLGGARLGVEHLAQVGELEAMTVDRHGLLVGCHDSIMGGRG